ncbi:hypothetical protein QCA50_005596 [Cerrena zonata]|uniref:Uncharacterized protein n=1 Tax=Cerrena zonata TaxID=2478898 RepID=A0AAW0GJT3_9APHY
MLGDIGWLGNQGQFIRLFNCFEDGHRNKSGLPPNFAYLHIPDDKKVEIHDDLRPGEILCTPGATILAVTDPEEASETTIQTYVVEPCDPMSPSPHGVVPAQYPVTIQHPNENWAFLMVQSPAQRRYFIPNDLIHPYIITHRENWLRLSVEQYHILHKDDFIFVSGQVQTRAWALGISQQKESVFKLIGEISDTAVRFQNPFPNRDCDARAGPDRPEIRDKVGENMRYNPFSDQSIFLNFYKARTRLIGPTKISATSKPYSPSGSEDRDTHRSMTSMIDPALRYILEVSPCEVAVASDIEIYHMLGESPWPDDLLRFLHELSPTVVCGTVAGVCYGRFELGRETNTRNEAVPISIGIDDQIYQRRSSKPDLISQNASQCRREPVSDHVHPTIVVH